MDRLSDRAIETMRKVIARGRTRVDEDKLLMDALCKLQEYEDAEEAEAALQRATGEDNGNAADTLRPAT